MKCLIYMNKIFKQSINILSAVILSAASCSALSQDIDKDGVEDEFDNCINVGNPEQRDSNKDGFGNICDGDLDNNNFINALDLAIMKKKLLTKDEDADLDGNGFVNALDLAILKKQLLKVPGPRGDNSLIDLAVLEGLSASGKNGTAYFDNSKITLDDEYTINDSKGKVFTGLSDTAEILKRYKFVGVKNFADKLVSTPIIDEFQIDNNNIEISDYVVNAIYEISGNKVRISELYRVKNHQIDNGLYINGSVALVMQTNDGDYFIYSFEDPRKQRAYSQKDNEDNSSHRNISISQALFDVKMPISVINKAVDASLVILPEDLPIGSKINSKIANRIAKESKVISELSLDDIKYLLNPLI